MVNYSKQNIPGEGGVAGRGAQLFGGGGGGGVATAASPFPGSDLSPDVVRARFNSSQLPTRVTLLNDNTLNAGTGAAGSAVISSWVPVGPFDRPMIVWPIDVPQGTSTDATGLGIASAPVGGQILYWPGQIPPTDADAFVSDGTCICYLSNPGLWWLKYTNIAASAVTKLTCLLIDASDPATAARLLNEPGAQSALTPGRTAGSNFLRVSAVSAQLSPASRTRTGLIIQNTGIASGAAAAFAARLAFGTTAINNAGIILAAGSSITLSGPFCWKGPINAILDITQAGPLVELVAQEFQ